ncbi:MAG TPA: AtpZ/AtpI family protein [Sphingobacteriaceae bacterium]
MQKNEEENGLKDEKKLLNNYVRYTGLGFQMIAVIGVFAFIGYKLDEWQQTKQPVYTALLSVIGVCAALYQVVRSLKNLKS